MGGFEITYFLTFPTDREGSLGARLIRIKQDGTYPDYLKKFLNYSTPLSEMTESVVVIGLGQELLKWLVVIQKHW